MGMQDSSPIENVFAHMHAIDIARAYIYKLRLSVWSIIYLTPNL